MENGYYRLEHTYYSRGGNKYHGPSSSFHLSAVQNYHANKNKAKHVLSINLPEDRYELYAALISHSNTIKRKNSHLSEGLIISFDNRMAEAHREEALKAFAHRVTFGGKIKAYAYEHLNDPNNKHAHMQVIDVGPDGKQVGHFGRNATFRRQHSPVKGNPKIWFRVAWEQECNAVLERHGYDFRIDHRSNVERGLEKAGKHKGWQQSLSQELSESVEGTGEIKELPELVAQTEVEPTNLDEPQSPDVPLAPEVDNNDEYLSDEEGPMVISRDGEHPSQVWIQDAVEYSDHRNNIHHIQAEIKQHEAAKEQAETDKNYYTELAGEYRKKATAAEQLASVTSDQLKPYTKEDGSLKGWRLSFWKFSVANKTRRQGEELTNEKNNYKRSQREALDYVSDSEQRKQMAENEARKAQLSAEASERSLNELLQINGSKKTLEQADQIFQDSIQNALSKVDLQDIWNAYQERLISMSQAVTAYELLGEHAMAEAIRNEPLEELEEDINDSVEVDLL